MKAKRQDTTHLTHATLNSDVLKCLARERKVGKGTVIITEEALLRIMLLGNRSFPEERDSAASIGSKGSLNSTGSRTRNHQASVSSRMRSNRNANIKTSRAELRPSTFDDESIAWWRPEDCSQSHHEALGSLTQVLPRKLILAAPQTTKEFPPSHLVFNRH